MKKMHIWLCLCMAVLLGCVSGMAYAEGELGNALIAVVNGEEMFFEQVSSRIDSNGEMTISYEAYSPRGTLMHQLDLIMDEQISPGRYSSADDNGIAIWLENRNYLSRGPKYVTSRITLGSHGRFDFKLMERSTDWSEYRGTLSAVAVGVDGAKGEITIEDAKFHFSVPFTGKTSGRSSYGSGGNSYSSGSSSYGSEYDWDDNSGRTCFSCGGNGRCDDCSGTGKSKYTKTEKCYTCMGSGKCIWCNGDGITGN